MNHEPEDLPIVYSSEGGTFMKNLVSTVNTNWYSRYQNLMKQIKHKPYEQVIESSETKAYKFVMRLLSVAFGSLIYSIAINAFIAPHHLLSGGVAGISLLCQYLTNIPAGVWVFVINIPIFLIGLKKVDKDFIGFSLFGMLSMSLLLILTKDIASLLIVDDIIVSTIFGAVLSGLGMGIIFKNRASQGGTDVIAVIIRSKSGIKISKLYFAINAFVVLIGAFVTSLQLALYTLISMYIVSTIMEKVIEENHRKKMLMVVTSKEKEVSKAIMNKIGRGITFLNGEGAYTGNTKRIIYCLVTTKEFNETKHIIEGIDNDALISVTDAAEVQGKSFLKPAI